MSETKGNFKLFAPTYIGPPNNQHNYKLCRLSAMLSDENMPSMLSTNIEWYHSESLGTVKSYTIPCQIGITLMWRHQ